MISKSKLGAIAFITAIGLASGLTSPAFAANYGPVYTAPSQTGGGNAGYNSRMANDYRLRPHHATTHGYYNYEAPNSAGPAPNSPGSNCPPMCWRLQHHHKWRQRARDNHK
jgi:hypothetical protein